MMNKIEKELNRVKYIAFGKVKVGQKPKPDRELEKLQNEKVKCYEDILNNEELLIEKVGKIDNDIAANLLTQQRKKFEEELKSMKDLKENKGKSALIFNSKEKIVGPKKVGQEATTLIDPKTKKVVCTPEEIKRIGPSGVRPLPLAAGINVGGHYFGPSGAVQTVSDSRRPLFQVIGPSVLRAPAEQTKVATVFGN